MNFYDILLAKKTGVVTGRHFDTLFARKLSGGAHKLVSIKATFTQGGNAIYVTDTLNDLKEYLVVTATYSDSTTATVTGYTLSGSLLPGTSTISVAYHGITDTFIVTVTDKLNSYSVFEPANAPSNYISGNSSGYRGDILNISASDFLATFYDGYISTPPTGVTVTKTSIGKDESGVYDIYEYEFAPTNYERTILLSSGLHAYELPAVFGLANFIGNLYTADDSAFGYIRRKVRIKVIPILNPWGFNQNPKKYGNVNGVNPNRNFDYDGAWANFVGNNEWNQKGDYPFSEAETRNMASWVGDNWDADFWIDCHTNNGSNEYDLDVYSLTHSMIETQIDNAIDRIEEWFADKYNVTPVTYHLLDNPGSIRQVWSEKASALPTFTLEQCPRRETYGTTAQNSAADIENYCTNLSTFVQELLMLKYETSTVAIVSATSPQNVTLPLADKSVTISGTVNPANTTQNKFAWVSSDESVCKVYGDSCNVVVVAIGQGHATLTATNKYDPTITMSCTVDVTIPQTQFYGKMCGTNSSTGTDTVVTNRVSSDMIPVSSGSITIASINGYYLGARFYDDGGAYCGIWSTIGKLDSSTITGNVPNNASYLRIVFKKPNNGDFSASDFPLGITINGVTTYIEYGSSTSYNTMYIRAKRGSISLPDGSYNPANINRISTDQINEDKSVSFTFSNNNGYYVKAFAYQKNMGTGVYTKNGTDIGNLATTSISGGTSSTGWPSYRVVFKKADNSDFTEEEVLQITGTFKGVPFAILQASPE